MKNIPPLQSVERGIGGEVSLPKTDRNPDLKDALLNRRFDLLGGERAVRILCEAAGRNVFHAVVAHTADAEIDRDRCPAAGDTEQHAAAGRGRGGEMTIEEVIGIAAAAAVHRAPEQRSADRRKAIKT